jgi:hypothetical protein
MDEGKKVVLATIADRFSINYVDESLFQKKNVFSLKLSDKVLYLGATQAMERDRWVYMLKSKDMREWRFHKYVHLRIIEGKGFNPNSDYYCEINVGNDRMARSNIRGKTSEPYWREEFIFE